MPAASALAASCGLPAAPARYTETHVRRLQQARRSCSGPYLRLPSLGVEPCRSMQSGTWQQERQNVSSFNSARRRVVASAAPATVATDVAGLVAESNARRMDGLEDQALGALQAAVQNFQRPAFPCALIAGDVCILHLLHRLDFLATGKVKIIFIDTFHLFDETYELLHQLEEKYNFKAHVFHAAGFSNRDEYRAAHGSDLYLTDIEAYDRICKVEPFDRALKTLEVDCMINGRRRDHGAERAFLEVFEDGKPVKSQPLAYWSFADCFAYLDKYSLERHPLHAQGYPSVGDVHSTVPVPEDKWFEWGGERSGRFQGLTNPDGTLKTECGIHSVR